MMYNGEQLIKTGVVAHQVLPDGQALSAEQ